MWQENNQQRPPRNQQQSYPSSYREISQSNGLWYQRESVNC